MLFFSHFQTLDELFISSWEEQRGSSDSQYKFPLLLLKFIARQRFSMLRRSHILHVLDPWLSLQVQWLQMAITLLKQWDTSRLKKGSSLTWECCAWAQGLCAPCAICWPTPHVVPHGTGEKKWVHSQPDSQGLFPQPTPNPQLNVITRICLFLY